MSESNYGIDYEKAPRHATGYRRYIERGIPPGHFLTAVLSNDLRDATGRADATNIELLAEHVRFVHNYAPMDCWGSRDAVESWIDEGGLEGRHG